MCCIEQQLQATYFDTLNYLGGGNTFVFAYFTWLKVKNNVPSELKASFTNHKEQCAKQFFSTV